ncbi:Uncharacterized protein BM_BM10661 [Brugia malayi]|uniref:Bm10661 n=1 Tax=Brugia malayi TaxID=6279 RepID=A0A4E9F4F3_BRUMA|nr:Uncharacterized protein BM_BM10661 [Brugia malayi]VIO90750.1 Uncharacterized protein BM_BM10661 [Brugia malayi]
MMDISKPITDSITKNFATFKNSDLLSMRNVCKYFRKSANEVLNERIKPLVIVNGTIRNAANQKIFSLYKQQLNTISASDDEFKNFSMLQKWHAENGLLFDDYNDLTPLKRRLSGPMYLRIAPFGNSMIIDHELSLYSGSKLSNGHPRSAIIFPKMPHASISMKVFAGRAHVYSRQWLKVMREPKLIVAFQNNALSLSDIMTTVDTKISPLLKDRSVPICYALQVESEIRFKRLSSFVVFHGSNVEASVFVEETANEEELRQKLLEWKNGLKFLESHHIVAFRLHKVNVEPENSEKIFSEIFGIELSTLRLPMSDRYETGSIYFNSHSKAEKLLGPTYAIVGFKKI